MRGRRLFLLEGAHDLADIFGRDALARIAHADHHLHAAADVIELLEGDADLAARGRELVGVGNEVCHDLRQAQFVANEVPRREIDGFHDKIDALCGHRAVEHILDFFSKRKHVHIRIEQDHLAAFDLGNIEDIVDHAEQEHRKIARPFEIAFRLLFIVDIHFCKRHHAHDTVHRRADLVAHARKEGRFRRRLRKRRV